VILARFGREAEVGGEKGAAKLGDQLLGGIAFVTPALAAEFPIKSGGMTSPMATFMAEGLVK